MQDSMKASDDRFADALNQGSGNVCILRVKGEKGEVIKMKADDGKVMFADDADDYIHIITMSEDTFIDILSGERTLRDAYARGYVQFRGEDWLVHAQKWAQAFDEMGYMLEQYVGFGPRSE